MTGWRDCLDSDDSPLTRDALLAAMDRMKYVRPSCPCPHCIEHMRRIMDAWLASCTSQEGVEGRSR